jgi:hypothetical protein
MARIYPAVPPDPALYRALFFVPLILVELTTLSLLTMTPMVRLARPACCWLALMLLVFAVWALAGFGYPSAPAPIALNVASKILAFVTALSLFFPEWFRLPGGALRRDGLAAAPDAAGGQAVVPGEGALVVGVPQDDVGQAAADHGAPVGGAQRVGAAQGGGA